MLVIKIKDKCKLICWFTFAIMIVNNGLTPRGAKKTSPQRAPQPLEVRLSIRDQGRQVSATSNGSGPSPDHLPPMRLWSLTWSQSDFPKGQLALRPLPRWTGTDSRRLTKMLPHQARPNLSRGRVPNHLRRPNRRTHSRPELFA